MRYPFIIVCIILHCTSSAIREGFVLSLELGNSEPKATLGYQMVHRSSQGIGTVYVGVEYNNQPGLLGDNGHLSAHIDTFHTNAGLDICGKLLAHQVNPFLDYNPVVIKLLQNKIEKKEKFLQKKELTKKKFSALQEHFKLMPSRPDDPDYIVQKQRIEKLARSYGC